MNNPEPNYFYVNRGLLHSDRWLSESFTRGQAWVDLFGLAQHTSGFFRVRGIKIDVERGQLAYSQLSLAKRWRWSRDKVRRYLLELENSKDIIQQNNKVTTLITIVKYNYWQGNKTTNNTTEKHQKNIRKTSNDTHTINDNNDKNDNNNVTEQSSVPNEVNKIIGMFKDVNPSYKQLYSRIPQRRAVERLVQEHGAEKIEKMIILLPRTNQKKYLPVITTPIQLEEKLGVLIFNLKKKTKISIQSL